MWGGHISHLYANVGVFVVCIFLGFANATQQRVCFACAPAANVAQHVHIKIRNHIMPIQSTGAPDAHQPVVNKVPSKKRNRSIINMGVVCV